MSNDENKHEEQQYIPLTFTRHSYSLNNANRFKKSIDKCINNKTDEFISAESLGISVNTLRHRLGEALLYLCNNDIKESNLKKEDYLRVRPFIKTTPVSLGNKPGVLLSWKVVKFTKALANSSDKLKAKGILTEATSSTVANQLSRLSVNKETGKDFHWKERVINFITDESAIILDISKPEEFRHIPLDSNDIEWLTTTFSKAGMEFEVEEYSIKAVKG